MHHQLVACGAGAGPGRERMPHMPAGGSAGASSSALMERTARAAGSLSWASRRSAPVAVNRLPWFACGGGDDRYVSSRARQRGDRRRRAVGVRCLHRGRRLLRCLGRAAAKMDHVFPCTGASHVPLRSARLRTQAGWTAHAASSRASGASAGVRMACMAPRWHACRAPALPASNRSGRSPRLRR